VQKRAHKFRLKFLFQEFDLNPGEYFVGRSPSCNLTLEDPLVSRRHVRITVSDDQALLDDLGSRNGTLVNGEPVFDNYRLSHSDRIRVGSHELVFVEAKRFSPMKQTMAGPQITCPGCGAPFPKDEPKCPVCGALFVPDNVCMHCRTPAPEDALFCPRCGVALRRDDSTIPVELGGGASGWTSKLIDEVIEKALLAKRHDQAAKLLDGKIEEYEKSAQKKKFDKNILLTLSKYNLALASKIEDPERVKWVVRHWDLNKDPMPGFLLDDLETALGGWCDISSELKDYLAVVESSKGELEGDPSFKKRILAIIEKIS
jgi:hypothetical protein